MIHSHNYEIKSYNYEIKRYDYDMKNYMYDIQKSRLRVRRHNEIKSQNSGIETHILMIKKLKLRDKRS